MQNLVTQYQTDYKSLKKDANQHEINLTSKLESKNEYIGGLNGENMKETFMEGITPKLQYMEQFLPTIIRDSNNNIKKRFFFDSQALLIQNGNSSTSSLLLAPKLL